MYLSRLILNPRSREVRRDLGDCHELHRTLLSAFPPTHGNAEGARAAFGLLYRQETHPRTGQVSVLVQSRTPPDWSKLPAGYLQTVGPGLANPATKQLDSQYAALSAGRRLLFRLRANPTKKVDTRSAPDAQRRNGRRVALRDEGEQLAWLRRKGEQAGFQLVAARVGPAATIDNARGIPEPDATGRRRERGQDDGMPPPQRLTFGSVLFEGELVIADAERFRAALEQGIGSGKAYGFGLLSVAPRREDAHERPARAAQGAG